MTETAAQTSHLWPMGLYFLAVLCLAAVMLGLSSLLGQRHVERATGQPYESGMVSAGPARMRFTAKFYLVGMLFVIFDLEAVFIYAWSIVVREAGWRGYGEILVFIGVLAAALFYLWRQGAFDWGKRRVKKQHGNDQGMSR